MYVFVSSLPKLLLRIYIFIWFLAALRLINYLHFFQKMFMLPDGVEVNRKVLSAVGEKVNEQTRNEANISNVDLGVKMLSNQRIHMQQKQNHSRPMTTPVSG